MWFFALRLSPRPGLTPTRERDRHRPSFRRQGLTPHENGTGHRSVATPQRLSTISILVVEVHSCGPALEAALHIPLTQPRLSHSLRLRTTTSCIPGGERFTSSTVMHSFITLGSETVLARFAWETDGSTALTSSLVHINIAYRGGDGLRNQSMVPPNPSLQRTRYARR